MFRLSRPTGPQITRYLASRQQADFTYAPIGGTREPLPTGYHLGCRRAVLGRGEAVFRQAQQALRDWKQFDLGWVGVTPNAPLQVGQVVGVIARTLGIWSLNPARIVYAVEPQPGDAVARFGFAYGTLPGHAAAGEERFLIEWDRSTDEVTYVISAFSRPDHWLAKLGRPYMRLKQRRFGVDSVAAMRRAIAAADPSASSQAVAAP